jgi:MioC protein
MYMSDDMTGDAGMSTLRVGIFVATMTGMAELCAEEIQSALGARGHVASIEMMDASRPEAFAPLDVVVIVSSTYGHGDIPDNGQAFFDALERQEQPIAARFAVFGLGDRTYADTFCHAGEKWDALLEAKGGRRVTPLERHDACSGTLAEDIAGGWAAGWAHRLVEAA